VKKRFFPEATAKIGGFRSLLFVLFLFFLYNWRGGKMGSGEEYIINCWHCRTAFNAFEAAYCNHLHPTLVCPFCLKCSCDAPEQYKQDFIRHCPKKLLEEKLTAEEGKDLKLGEILLKAGKISEYHLNRAIQEQNRTKCPLGEIFIRMGLISPAELELILLDQKSITHLNLDKFEVDFDLLEKVGKQFCLRYKIVPIEFVEFGDQQILRFVVAAKEDLYRLKLIDALAGFVLVPYLADKGKIEALLKEIEEEDILVLK
jgi:hypothetical protein